MYGNHFCSALFESLCEIFRDELAVFDTDTHLAGDSLAAFRTFFDYSLGKIRVSKQRASFAVVKNFRHGTAEVYIDYIEFFERFRLDSPSHNFGIVSENLNAFYFFERRSSQQGFRVFVAENKTFRAHHFGKRKSRPVFFANFPHRKVGKPCERSEKYVVFGLEIAYFNLFYFHCSSGRFPWRKVLLNFCLL